MYNLFSNICTNVICFVQLLSNCWKFIIINICLAFYEQFWLGHLKVIRNFSINYKGMIDALKKVKVGYFSTDYIKRYLLLWKNSNSVFLFLCSWRKYFTLQKLQEGLARPINRTEGLLTSSPAQHGTIWKQ